MTIPFCVLPFALLFGGLVCHLYRTRRDELTIYEHGFVYESGKNLRTCRWKDIKICHRRQRNAREMTVAEWEKFPLGAIEKTNGEIIEFDNDLEGTAEIIEQFEKSEGKNSKSKRRNLSA